MAFVDSNKKIEMDEILLEKKTNLTGNVIFGLIWRVALDCHIFGYLDKIVNIYLKKLKMIKLI